MFIRVYLNAFYAVDNQKILSIFEYSRWYHIDSVNATKDIYSNRYILCGYIA